MNQAAVLSLEEKRLITLLRRAALAHIRREYAEAGTVLRQLARAIERANRFEWAHALSFARAWERAVHGERAAESLPCAPAAWIHLGQELASHLERGGDWIAYLDSRWVFRTGKLRGRTRIAYGALGAAVLSLGALILFTMTSRWLSGGWVSPVDVLRENALGAVLQLARFAGAVVMVEHGYTWLRKAWRAEGEGSTATFLAARARLSLVPERESTSL